MRLVKHPNVISLLGFEATLQYSYLVLPYMEGGDLVQFSARIRSGNPGCTLVYQSLAYQIIAGVAYLHSLNIIHRDLKPQNIFVAHDSLLGYRIKIGDLGVARVLSCVAPKSKTPGMFPFTHLPPEMILTESPDQYGQKSDLWAMGIIIYWLLTGQPLMDKAWLDESPRRPKMVLYDRITQILGDPDLEDWPEVADFPQYYKTGREGNKDILRDKIAQTHSQVDQWSSIIFRVIRHNPTRRVNASKLLRDPFFDPVRDPRVESETRSCLQALRRLQLPIRGEITSLSIGVDWRVRLILLDWIIGVGGRFKVSYRSIILALYLHDYLSISNYISDREDYQLFGSACLDLASDQIEIYPPEKEDYVFASAKSFSEEDLIEMNNKIVRDTSIIFPTSYDFLVQIGNLYNAKVQSLARGLILFLIMFRDVVRETLKENPEIVSALSLIMSCRYFEERFKNTSYLKEIPSRKVGWILRQLFKRLAGSPKMTFTESFFKVYHPPSEYPGIKKVFDKIYRTSLTT